MNILPIQDIISGCRKNNRKSQKALYQLFYSFSMKICLRYAKDKEEAIEIVNDGFMRVFTHIGRYDSAKSFKSWLSTIMINTAIDYYRRRIKSIEMEELNDKHDVEDAESILSRMHYEDLISLVQKLSLAYRTVFNLFVIDGYSHEEISKMLSISTGASKSNLFKAREQLKRMLREAGSPVSHSLNINVND
ncbi:sigma-70 family RNA polymerase sigma factor [Pedobacter sp. BS3]|uniref:RNA polymerase sigma factor n=1 Tax=Pedobacter sp. BS3 TaxID=2567937 RepID=UPI0011EC8FE4|nr:sigma-70 family RNA polymerase sigma factor [Pedobacter sp. BS3]TZF82251.1 sigma-70 family RNA polymerase sigma factor [Pedobacter sp. BS3]